MLEAFTTGYLLYLIYLGLTGFYIFPIYYNFPLLFIIMSIFLLYFLFNVKKEKKKLLMLFLVFSLIPATFFLYFLFKAKTEKKNLLTKSIIALLFIIASNSVFVFVFGAGFLGLKELQQIQSLLLYFILFSLFLLLLFVIYILLKYSNKFWFIFIFSNLLLFAYSYAGIVFASGMCFDSCNVVPSFYEKVFAGLGGFVALIMVIFSSTMLFITKVKKLLI